MDIEKYAENRLTLLDVNQFGLLMTSTAVISGAQTLITFALRMFEDEINRHLLFLLHELDKKNYAFT